MDRSWPLITPELLGDHHIQISLSMTQYYGAAPTINKLLAHDAHGHYAKSAAIISVIGAG